MPGSKRLKRTKRGKNKNVKHFTSRPINKSKPIFVSFVIPDKMTKCLEIVGHYKISIDD